MKVLPLRLGLLAGCMLAGIHALWAALVASALAQPLMNFLFWAHSINPPWQIEPFSWDRTLALLGFTFLMGAALGIIGGGIWNRFVPGVTAAGIEVDETYAFLAGASDGRRD